MTEVSEFAVDVDMNSYLAEDATDVDAIVTVTSSGGHPRESSQAAADGVEVIIIDCSSSMEGARIRAAREATRAAIAELRDGVTFAVIAGTKEATFVYPPPRAGTTAVAGESTRAEASEAVGNLKAKGGTAIGSWLTMAGRIADWSPGAIKHAILLTDGKNEHEDEQTFRAAIEASRGRFTCDCRGIGTDWRVEELRTISSVLLGTVDIVADPADLAADFSEIMNSAMGKTTAGVALRLWTPRGAEVRFVKQVEPTVDDLTDRRTETGSQRGDYPLGSWGAESRDYHIGVRVTPGSVGDEMLAGRVSVLRAGSEEVLGQGLVKAIWTDDTRLSSRISASVAHYTGQAELAEEIQQGLAAREAGEVADATARLGRAVALATESGNEDTARLLERVVDVVDAPSGTVQLRRHVSEADKKTLATRSTRTARVRSEQ